MVEDGEGFKVTDRRGQQREFAVSPGPGPGPAPGTGAAPPPPPTPPSRPSSPGAAPGTEPGDQPDLTGLFMMFATSALVGLGAAVDPVSGERRVDLEQAREGIETLRLLRARTEGNRTERESGLLEEILYDLQMRFVQATRRTGQPG